MRSTPSRGGGSFRRLTLLFLAVLVPPAAALVWLGVHLLEQDRTFLAQRESERREAAADSITHSLAQSLADAEAWVTDDRFLKGRSASRWRDRDLDRHSLRFTRQTGRCGSRHLSDCRKRRRVSLRKRSGPSIRASASGAERNTRD